MQTRAAERGSARAEQLNLSTIFVGRDCIPRAGFDPAWPANRQLPLPLLDAVRYVDSPISGICTFVLTTRSASGACCTTSRNSFTAASRRPSFTSARPFIKCADCFQAALGPLLLSIGGQA